MAFGSRKAKQVQRDRQARWSQALAEGRVVRAMGGMTLTAYPTRERALEAVQTAHANGYATVYIVDPLIDDVNAMPGARLLPREVSNG